MSAARLLRRRRSVWARRLYSAPTEAALRGQGIVQEPAVYREERIFSRLAGGACKIYRHPHAAGYAAHVRRLAVLTFFVAFLWRIVLTQSVRTVRCSPINDDV